MKVCVLQEADADIFIPFIKMRCHSGRMWHHSPFIFIIIYGRGAA